jgi:hypothetical protein
MRVRERGIWRLFKGSVIKDKKKNNNNNKEFKNK